MPAFLPYGFFPLMTTQQKETKKNSDHLWQEKRINKNQEYSFTKFTRVPMPKDLFPQIFSPANLNLERGKKKKRTHVYFH